MDNTKNDNDGIRPFSSEDLEEDLNKSDHDSPEDDQ